MMHEREDQTETARTLCDALGRREIATRVGRSITAVSNAAVDGAFPASWYVVIRRMCDEREIGCPDHLFSFVRLAVDGEAS